MIVIHSELFKKLKSYHTNKWSIHNPESVQENETPKLLCDFEIQTDYLISARRPDSDVQQQQQQQQQQQKREPAENAFCRPSRPQRKIERKQKERLISGPC